MMTLLSMLREKHFWISSQNFVAALMPWRKTTRTIGRVSLVNIEQPGSGKVAKIFRHVCRRS